jgi:hypothetical protein
MIFCFEGEGVTIFLQSFSIPLFAACRVGTHDKSTDRQ